MSNETGKEGKEMWYKNRGEKRVICHLIDRRRRGVMTLFFLLLLLLTPQWELLKKRCTPPKTLAQTRPLHTLNHFFIWQSINKFCFCRSIYYIGVLFLYCCCRNEGVNLWLHCSPHARRSTHLDCERIFVVKNSQIKMIFFFFNFFFPWEIRNKNDVTSVAGSENK